MIDLAKSDFWLLAFIAIISLTPLVSVLARHVVFALANLLFLSCIWEGPGICLWVIGGTGIYWLILKGIAGRRYMRGFVVTGLMLACGAFVFYKFGLIGVLLPALKPVNSLLAAVSFSYVFLRLLDVLKEVAADRSSPGFLFLFNYLFPFHMLAAGPIQAYKEYTANKTVPSALERKDVLEALNRIVTGLFKKYVLAYLLIQMFSTRWQAEGIYALFEVNIHYLWLFLDFSAYSDIAVGLGILIGFRAPENFNKPYLARNITDFWDRWHISLSLFIRRNIFMPIQVFLQRRTRGKYALACACISIFTAFVLCGAWHAFTVKFILWGCLHGVGLMTCQLYRAFLQKKLGGAGVKNYLSNPWIHTIAVIITFEYVAFSLALIGDQWNPTW